MPTLMVAHTIGLVGIAVWLLGFRDSKSSDLWAPFLMLYELAFQWVRSQMYATLTITDTHICARCPLMPRWLRWFHTEHWDVALVDIANIEYFTQKNSQNSYANWRSQLLQLTLRNGKKRTLFPAMWFIPKSPAKRLLPIGFETLPLITALRKAGLHVPLLDSTPRSPGIQDITSPSVKWFLGASLVAFLMAMVAVFFGINFLVEKYKWLIFVTCCLIGCIVFCVFFMQERPLPPLLHALLAIFAWCAVMLFFIRMSVS